LTDFSPDKTSYTVSGIPQGMTYVKIISLVPVYAGANAAVSYTPEGGETTAVADGDVKSAKIPLPAVDKTMSVNIKVGAKEHLVEYAVEFRNPAASTVWNGTAVLSGDSASGYEITGIEAVTADGAVHQAGFSNPAWSAAVSKAQGAPVSFAAALKKTGTSDTNIYRVTAAAGNMTSSGSNVITFMVKDNDAANPVYLTVINASQLANMQATQNYYLENNITLDQTSLGKNWDGPDSYKGHFNGNGKTITLELSKVSGDTGLFDSLAGKAVIENLNVAVSTKDGSLAMGGASHFGGVVGLINESSGEFTLKNISVTGELNYTIAGSSWLLAGALIGEIKENKTVTIENCRAIINISVTNAYITDEDNTLGIGGLIGKTGTNTNGGAVSITNCRTEGSISGKAYCGRDLIAGGLIGVASNLTRGNDAATVGKLTIKNCYSTMDITLTKTDNGLNSNYHTLAGGLVGHYSTSNTGSIISNSAALNKKLLAISAEGVRTNAGRIAGRVASSGKLADNYALKGMVTGTSNSGSQNDDEGSLDTAAGLGEDASFFQDKSNWLSIIGFTEDNWDFSNVAKDGYPTLKFKK
jgi:hypothetical protein